MPSIVMFPEASVLSIDMIVMFPDLSTHDVLSVSEHNIRAPFHTVPSALGVRDIVYVLATASS